MYKGKKRHEMPPHIYAIADTAYRSMLQGKMASPSNGHRTAVSATWGLHLAGWLLHHRPGAPGHSSWSFGIGVCHLPPACASKRKSSRSIHPCRGTWPERIPEHSWAARGMEKEGQAGKKKLPLRHPVGSQESARNSPGSGISSPGTVAQIRDSVADPAARLCQCLGLGSRVPGSGPLNHPPFVKRLLVGWTGVGLMRSFVVQRGCSHPTVACGLCSLRWGAILILEPEGPCPWAEAIAGACGFPFLPLLPTHAAPCWASSLATPDQEVSEHLCWLM